MQLEKIELISKGIEKLALKASTEQIQTMNDYLNLVLEWNSRINLTAISEYDEAVTKHLLDSLIVFKFLNLKEKHIVDIGSGAGFPGIPLAIYCSSSTMNLVESSRKKCNFLLEAINKFQLKNVTVTNERVEIVGRETAHRGNYDVVVSRAVGRLSILVEYSLPLLVHGGILVVYKGPNVKQEIEDCHSAFQKLGGGLKNIYHFNLPFSGDERTIITIEKDKPTPEKYPRRVGIPVKRPL